MIGQLGESWSCIVVEPNSIAALLARGWQMKFRESVALVVESAVNFAVVIAGS